LASELFGHAKGAFTGAVQAKPGLFETADGGTLFLDEIGDMDLSVQPHLLTVLEEQTFRRLGEVQVRSANVRLIAATHQNLAQLSREKAFRSDLYYRISTLPLSLPPLRERREDIPQLVRTMLARMADASGREVPEISPQALERLTNHPWPGNIRELRNTLERAFWLMRGSQLQESDLRFDVDGESEPLVVNLNHLTMEEMERRHIEAVLEREKGSVSRAAKALDVPRSSLYKKIRKYNIERSE
jgi:DNA-binding NtrC family response regulator